ncbi:Crp/Fnr family transcriptional regulator [Thermotoga sp. KOL6]|uniref:Crp/Fnr family transcriptional regulator n=1 Tax=Thermotoga sp. KOL6 TaxID=126741 RepID=UPI000C76B369|nr:Crp/Fnr family transcriptional regulator [Thermotoga sp. KOL6]PLV59894.1 Crp/Fnr family transcriptional regulator [Thermotoga sp. KOL6]
MVVDKLFRNGKIFSYRKGQMIVHQGDPINDVMILIEGSLKTEHVSESGKVLEIDIIKPVQIVASGLIFSKNPRFPVNIVAENDVKILIVTKKKFLELLMSDEELLLFFLEDVSEHFKIISEKLFFLTTKTLKEKVIEYLLHHANDEKEVILPVSIEELSKIFGCARPALSRVFRELEEEGYIRRKGKQIKILKTPH